MALMMIIELAVIILGIILIWKLGKSVLKIVGFVILTIVLLTAGVLYFGYTDLADMKENFPSQEKLFLLEDNDQVLAGITLTEVDRPEGIGTLSDEELNTASELYEYRKMKELRGDSYKIFIFQLDPMLEDIGSLQNMGKEELSATLKTEQVPSEVKSAIFAGLFTKKMDDEGPLYVISGYKNKEIKVYPETPIFKIVRYTPKFITNMIAR